MRAPSRELAGLRAPSKPAVMDLPATAGRTVLRRAVEFGVNHIDTADFYRSADGSVRANKLIREALSPYPPGLVIATKVGPVFGPDGPRQGTAADIRPQVEANLQALGLDWANLHQRLRQLVPDDLYRSGSVVELIETRPDGTTLRLLRGGPADFDLVVCADGYHSMGRRLIATDATPRYRGMVLWRGFVPESDIRADALGGCDLMRVGYRAGHGVVYYIPGAGQSPEPGNRLLMWGYYLQVPQGDLSSVLVDDKERQQSGSIPFGKVHPKVRAGFESRLAELLPSSLFELVQRGTDSSIQAVRHARPHRHVGRSDQRLDVRGLPWGRDRAPGCVIGRWQTRGSASR